MTTQILAPGTLPPLLASHRAVKSAVGKLEKAEAGVTEARALADSMAGDVARAVEQLDEAAAQRANMRRQSAELAIQIAQRRVDQAQDGLADAVRIARIDAQAALAKQLRSSYQRWLDALVAAGEAVTEAERLEDAARDCGVQPPHQPLGGTRYRGDLRMPATGATTPIQALFAEARSAGYRVPAGTREIGYIIPPRP